MLLRSQCIYGILCVLLYVHVAHSFSFLKDEIFAENRRTENERIEDGFNHNNHIIIVILIIIDIIIKPPENDACNKSFERTFLHYATYFVCSEFQSNPIVAIYSTNDLLKKMKGKQFGIAGSNHLNG